MTKNIIKVDIKMGQFKKKKKDGKDKKEKKLSLKKSLISEVFVTDQK